MAYYEKIAERVFNMAKVYMFPQQKKLPSSLEERLNKIGREYIELLYATLTLMCQDSSNQEEMEEITALVTQAYADGMLEAIDEMEES